MDLGLYARVLWRHKLIVILGVLVAISLAGLSVFRVSSNGLTYRQSELWSSTTRLLVTQQGFPLGRLLATQGATPEEQAAKLGIPLADPVRLNTLAVLYAELATSDPVMRQMRKAGPIRGKIIATPVVVGENRIMLPLIDLVSIAKSPQVARSLATRSADAFGTYLRTQQAENNVPPADRVIVQQLVQPRKVTVFQPRSKTLPVVVLLAVMFGTVGFAFLIDNVRRKPGADEAVEGDFAGAARRTA